MSFHNSAKRLKYPYFPLCTSKIKLFNTTEFLNFIIAQLFSIAIQNFSSLLEVARLGSLFIFRPPLGLSSVYHFTPRQSQWKTLRFFKICAILFSYCIVSPTENNNKKGKLNMNKKFNAKQLTLLGLMTALLLLMSFTPLGYLNIGPLAITFNVIPVAVSALALGPVGGLIAGSVFGLTSFLQAIGVGGVSMLGSTLFSINPFFSILLCFVPRMLDGFLLGYIFRSVSKLNRVAACFVTGFAAAFLNTLFFMSALILLFGQTEYMQGLINGQNILLFVCAFVGVNAVFEMLSSTVITGAVGSVLLKAGFIQTPAKKAD